MARNRFQSDKTVRIELKDGDWIEVKETIGWQEFEPIQAEFKSKGPGAIINLLKLVLKAWSFTDGEKEVPCTPENIEKIEIRTIEEVSLPLMELYLPEKKSLPLSEPLL